MEKIVGVPVIMRTRNILYPKPILVRLVDHARQSFMGLADQPASYPSIAQITAHRVLADFERNLVPTCAMAMKIAPRLSRHTGRAAQQRPDIDLVKPHAFGSQ